MPPLSHYTKILSFLRLMGISWVLFRFKYELLKKINYFTYKNKRILSLVTTINYSEFNSNIGITNKNYSSNTDTKKADAALKGSIFSFSHDYFKYVNENGEINWHKNPTNNKIAPEHIAWNQLPDFGGIGDIKCIWEGSRFPQVFYFIDAYSLTKDKKYAKGCIKQICHWIDQNPFPNSVHYKCGQEISFRLFAWFCALDYFDHYLTQTEKEKILKNIHISLLRIDINIDFAAKSVRNNHSISEAAGLLLGGLLFPEFPKASYIQKKGMTYLLQEIRYQIYDDGTYIQHSFNYQRLATDVISFVIMVLTKKNIPIPKNLLNRHKKLYTCLYSFTQKNGYLPNYGSNDGAYLFPIGSYDYRDFRHSLNFASMVNEGTLLFSQGRQIVNLFNGNVSETVINLEKKSSFSTGGYYILKNDRIFIFIRCHTYKDRPAQNDPLHMDIWIDGKNIFSDAGSYSYNTKPETKKQFTGMTGHNTLMIQEKDPMQPVLNFGYTNWIKGRVIKHSENEIICEHDGYKKEFGVTHRRHICLSDTSVVIKETLRNQKKALAIKQIWNTTFPIEFKQAHVIINKNVKLLAPVNPKKGKYLYSSVYNSYTENDKIYVESTLKPKEYIESKIEIDE